MTGIKKPRGTIDILPGQARLWQRAEAVMRKTAALYGFEEMRFPTFEQTELFSRGVGGTTDIVQKEMYTFPDREGRSLTLRPEGTACIARSVIENGLYSGAMPLKYYYIANFFRYEKPQAGRSREFWQFGTELFGADGPEGDATVILLADRTLKELGLSGCRLNLNMIGCKNCRPAYQAALVECFRSKENELCPTCRERLETNPLRILDCKDPSCSALVNGAPRSEDHLCADCREHFARLKELLSSAGVEYTVNPRIVRGLDYYTGAVFEFISDKIGAQSTVCGGGRYGGLIAELGGPDLSGVGFGMGLTRIILAMEAEGLADGTSGGAQVYIAPTGDGEREAAFALAEQLRALGIRAETDLAHRSLKAQMKYADKTGAEHTIVLGTDELETGSCTLADMRTGEKKKIALSAREIHEILK